MIKSNKCGKIYQEDKKMIARKKKIQEIILLAILVALATILSYIDSLISRIAFSFLPTAKIGLSNIIVLFSIY